MKTSTPDAKALPVEPAAGFRFDPLKLYYHPILETDDVRDVTPFQGFSISWPSLLWAIDMIAQLPADVLEPSSDVHKIVAQRVGGFRLISWAPLSIQALEAIPVEFFGPFLILFSGEDASAKRASAWAARQSRAVLHISTISGEERIDPTTFGTELLRDYCQKILVQCPQLFSADQRAAAQAALPLWAEPKRVPSGLKNHGHNVTHPNYVSLLRSGRSLDPGEPFTGRTELDYTKLILETANAVLDVRSRIDVQPFHHLSLFRPPLILAEPALYRMSYKPIRVGTGVEEKVAEKTLRLMQKQKGLYDGNISAFLDENQESAIAQTILGARATELRVCTAGLGLHAAQTAAAVVRLSPGVNHVFPALSAYARSDRSAKLASRLKARRLFDSIQTQLEAAVGQERIALIERTGGPIKIVSDAPIEWLPVGKLPLSLRFDCSRINATPGNLLMAEMIAPSTVTFTPQALQKVLIVTCFSDDDPLRDMLTSGMMASRGQWQGKVDVTFRRAQSLAEFISALNDYDGEILIFDGHGADNSVEPVGKLIIGNDAIDVWGLRNKVRVPPIVILSACDTHGLDALSHATVGNGFLALGARTVLATLLPVNAYQAALFVARLIHRLADFIGAALSSKRRVLNWTEIMSGMLKMSFSTELLDELIGPPAPEGSARWKLQLAANMDINSREEENWYTNLLEAISRERNLPLGSIESKARDAMARCDSIRYIQLGNPETILIDDGSTLDRVHARLKELQGANEKIS
jgi:hypothetical protein